MDNEIRSTSHARLEPLGVDGSIAATPAPDRPEIPLQRSVPSSCDRLSCELAVIVPTRNERGNIPRLLERLAPALHGRSAAVLFVDDSDDDTPQVIQQARRAGSLDVKLLHRPPGRRAGGLGGAVLEGFRRVDAPWAVVMDGDLQHPPELVPELVDTGRAAGADVVVASRHVAGGSTAGLSNWLRVLVSDASIVLSKLFFPRRLKGITDPMSGFFAVRPDALDLDGLRPAGFKILLEVLARTPGLRKAEVAFVFAERHSGESKTSLKEGVRFARQLGRLSFSRLSLRRNHWLGRTVGFAGVGLTGLVVNLLAMWTLADPTMLGAHYLVAAAIATQISSTWNFFFTDRLVYVGPKRFTAARRWAGFVAMSNLVLLLRLPTLALLVGVLGVNYLLATAATLVAGFLVRFQSQERLTITQEMT